MGVTQALWEARILEWGWDLSLAQREIPRVEGELKPLCAWRMNLREERRLYLLVLRE